MPALPAQDLEPSDVPRINEAAAYLVGGLAESWRLLRAIEERLNDTPRAEGVVPLGRRQLEAARHQLRTVFAAAERAARRLGVVLPLDQLAQVAAVSADVGRITRDQAERLRPALAPSAGIFAAGEGLAAAALAKGGARGAQALVQFARAAVPRVRSAIALAGRAGLRYAGPALGWLAFAASLRVVGGLAGGGIGSFLSSLIATPGGALLAGLVAYYALSRRK